MPAYPKHHSLRARRNKAATATELIPYEPDEIEIPDLPERFIVKDGERTKAEWHPEAVATWTEVWSSPMIREFMEADSGGIRTLLLLEHQMWEKFEKGRGISEIAAEISRIRKTYGLAPMGRRSLQWIGSQTEETNERRARAHLKAVQPKSIDATVEDATELPEAATVLQALE